MIRRTFLKSLFGAAVALPFTARPAQPAPVVLQHSPLAGFQFHHGEAVWTSLSLGDPLVLVREPDNPHDDRAVAVHWRGRKLGYVPRTDNCTIAQLLDCRRPVSARILRLKETNNPWRRITLEISLLDT